MCVYIHIHGNQRHTLKPSIPESRELNNISTIHNITDFMNTIIETTM